MNMILIKQIDPYRFSTLASSHPIFLYGIKEFILVKWRKLLK